MIRYPLAPFHMAKVRLLTRPTIGLKTDVNIIQELLASRGIVADKIFPRGRNLDLLHRQIICKFLNIVKSENMNTINIFSEQVMPGWLPLAKYNLFIPNQEWCRPETIKQLNKMDIILCKTYYAESIFRELGYPVLFTGFTSDDKHRPVIEKNYNKFIHVAGRSSQKGTATLARTWARRPDWPELTIISRNAEELRKFASHNIKVISRVLTDDELSILQNEAGVHICASEAEGYGHYIGEALGCGAVVVTTDAPPMNELVQPSRGFLVPYDRCNRQSLGTNYYVSSEALEYTIQRVLDASGEQKIQIGNNARSWFIENRKSFEERLFQALAKFQ